MYFPRVAVTENSLALSAHACGNASRSSSPAMPPVRALALTLTLACAAALSLDPNATHLFLDADGFALSENISFSLGDIRKEYAAPAVVPEYAWEEGLHFYTSAVTVPGGAVAGLEAVGCEACHGPGKAHVAKPPTVEMIAKPDVSVCVDCHDGKQDGGRFDHATYLPKVTH